MPSKRMAWMSWSGAEEMDARRLSRGLRHLSLLGMLVGLSGCSLVGFPAGGSSGDGGRPPIVPTGSAGTTRAPTPTMEPPAREPVRRPRPMGTVPAEGEEDPETFVIPDGARAPDNGRTYEVFGVEYQVLHDARDYDDVGLASWYGPDFHGRPTSSGERYDQYGLSAAHRTLPLHTFVEVTNTLTGESVVLRVNDRGPFASTDERIIDVSYGAALRLSLIGPGTAPVRVRAIGWPGQGN